MLLDRERRRRGVPVAVIVREALAAHLGGGSSNGVGGGPRLWFVGLGRSGHDNVSQEAEEILNQVLDRIPDYSIDRENSQRFTDRAAANGWITMPARTNL